MLELSAYLRAEACRPFAFCSADCVTLVADWVRACRGVDPMPEYRGAAGRADAEAVFATRAGFLRAFGRAGRRLGIAMTREPQAGDVAIVEAGGTVVPAIRSHARWAMRQTDGAIALLPLDRVRVIAAWRI